MKIAITFNLKPHCHPERSEGSALKHKKQILRRVAPQDDNDDAFEEFDAPETIEAIASVFRGKDHEVVLIEADSEFIEKIQKEKPDFVFNIAEGLEGPNRESHVPMILEFLGIPYSHSDGFALTLSLDKELTKMIARRQGIRTPDSTVILSPQDEGSAFKAFPQELKSRSFASLRMTEKLSFPIFLKPLREGSSKGIRNSSVVKNSKELENECARLWQNYGNIPLIAEQYIRGREITVGVLGTKNPKLIGMMEIRWQEKEKHRGDFVYSYETKHNWREWVEYEAPAPLSKSQAVEIESMAIEIHKALECRDVSRIDFRVDEKGIPYFIEINPLPGLSPDYSDLVIMIRQLGMEYRSLILSIYAESIKRSPDLKRFCALKKRR